MNYIREINAFYDWLETNLLSTSGIVLWHALMAINNKAGWAAEFAVAVSVLCVKTGLAPRSISKARNELTQKGRIKWRSRKGNQAAIYSIIPLSASGADSYADNHADKCADSYADNHATLNKLNETKQSSSCSRVQDIQTSLQTSGILAPSFPEIQRLEYWVDEGMELNAVKFAIEKAALANKRRVDYIEGILRNWFNAGIRTKQQAEAEVERFKQEKGCAKIGPTGKEAGNAGSYSAKNKQPRYDGTGVDWSKEPDYL